MDVRCKDVIVIDVIVIVNCKLKNVNFDVIE